MPLVAYDSDDSSGSDTHEGYAVDKSAPVPAPAPAPANGNSSEKRDERQEETLDKKGIPNPFDSNLYEDDSSESQEEADFEDNPCPGSSGGPESGDGLREASASGSGAYEEVLSQASLSVFSNPFKEAEKARKAVLEKHVKMTADLTSSSVDQRDGKKRKLCWNYHKHGRCKFGSQCKYGHESEGLLKRPETKEPGDAPKKRRVGLTDSVVPPKRALKAYQQQQKQRDKR